MTYRLKKTQIFTVSIKNLEYQFENKTMLKTDSKNVILKKYHDLLNKISQKTLIYFSLIINIIKII